MQRIRGQISQSSLQRWPGLRALAWREILIASALFIGALALYMASAALLGRTDTPRDSYFDLLTEAFLHGRLYLTNPPVNYDLTNHLGRWYVPFPPLPALLILPWAAIVGVEQVNMMLFGAVMGAANVALAFALLQTLSQRGWSNLGLTGNLWLTLLFGAGSVHWYMSTLGSVWFLAQICSVTFVLAACWSVALTGSAWLGSALLACAMLGRPHLALSYPLLLALAMLSLRGPQGWPSVRIMLLWCVKSALPMLIAGGLLLWYNYARFGDIRDFGYLSQNVSLELRRDLWLYGQFNLRYVPHNLWTMLLAGPIWKEQTRQIVPTIYGMSLLLTTPALIYLAKSWQPRPLAIGAWAALILLLIPLITYYNNGWWQFGYRFSLDFMTPVLVLLALAAEPRVSWRMALLILLGVAVNAWGTWWFHNPAIFT